MAEYYFVKNGNEYLNRAHLMLKTVNNYLTEPGWTTVSNECGTILKKKYFPKISAIACYILTRTISKSQDYLVSKIWDVDERIVKAADPDILSWRTVESGENWKVCHQINSAPWPIWPRELLFAQVKIRDPSTPFRFEMGPQTTWLVGFSIKHDDVPPDSTKYVRANIHMTVWGFTYVGPTKTRVTRVVLADPGGYIPEFFVDATVGKHVRIINDLGTE